MARLELAIWHPAATVAQIEKAVGYEAKIKFEVGDDRDRGSGRHDRTYCRFDVSSDGQSNFDDDLSALVIVLEGAGSSVDTFDQAKVVVYVTAVEEDVEIYLRPAAIKTLALVGAGVAFRP